MKHITHFANRCVELWTASYKVFFVQKYNTPTLAHTHTRTKSFIKVSGLGQPFFYMAFACCVNVYMVSVHTSSK